MPPSPTTTSAYDHGYDDDASAKCEHGEYRDAPCNPCLVADLKLRFNAAYDAWQEALAAVRALRASDLTATDPNGRGTPEGAHLIATAKAVSRIEADLRLARSGRTRKSILKGHVECDRCGGFGGHAQWPGYVCFKCEGHGSVEQART